ncbi:MULTISPECIES: polysaccharide biosynthesis/export family protein [Roseobacteraceae]|uniref:polysaccharide biosynthesis/export family protein n=1 Tax=Roseobacteraceae TaxID=2854170 RepID=UPI000A4A77C7|nr:MULTISPECIES: polysaccharide biosynthesis/export family protein [Roseobacteraceae]MCA0995398.1 polysaccharide biosynthesis/export family protein [Alloyangia pacifica]
MSKLSRNLIALVAGVAILGGCSLPRGAAVQSEVLSEADAEYPSFQVIDVTRANMPLIASWPRTGPEMDRNWLGTSTGANQSVIQTGDLVNIRIWDSQENSLLTNPSEKSTEMPNVEVGANGAIFLPYVDEVFIRGLTPNSARQRIQSKLEAIVPTAQVQLSLTQGRSNSVEMVGGVSSPGSYAMPSRNYKILGLIADAGGISSSMKNPLVRLMRQGATYEISANTLLGSGSYNTLLLPGDTVVVEEDDRTFTGMGASSRQTVVNFPKEEVNALEALSLMGGLYDVRADPKGVMVLREYSPRQLRSDGSAPNMQQVVFTFDLTSADGLFAARKFQIYPDDVVLATESPLAGLQTLLSIVNSGVTTTQRSVAAANAF